MNAVQATAHKLLGMFSLPFPEGTPESYKVQCCVVGWVTPALYPTQALANRCTADDESQRPTFTDIQQELISMQCMRVPGFGVWT